MTTSAQVRSQLIQALTLDLVGPTPDVLAQLALQGRTEEATELREEVLDRPPNRWYQSGFLISSETSLGDRADDAAEDEFAGLDGQNLSAKRKSNASGDDTGPATSPPPRQKTARPTRPGYANPTPSSSASRPNCWRPVADRPWPSRCPAAKA